MVTTRRRVVVVGQREAGAPLCPRKIDLHHAPQRRPSSSSWRRMRWPSRVCSGSGQGGSGQVAAAFMEEETASETSVPAAASVVTELEASGRRHGDTGAVPVQDEKIQALAGYYLCYVRFDRRCSCRLCGERGRFSGCN